VFDVATQAPAANRTRLSVAHADIAIQTTGAGEVDRLYVRSDAQGSFAPEDALLDVLPGAKVTVTSDPRFAFLGKGDIWVLPQAVVGRHVHGDTDPHIWLDPANAMAYVRLIRDTLSGLDPNGAELYASNAARYIEKLTNMDAEIGAKLATLPADQRKLVTTHDAFGYLAARWGLTVVGFVVASPAQEPSASQVAELQTQIKRSGVKAVFVEPQLVSVGRILENAARDAGAKVCHLYSDAYDKRVTSYEVLMRYNADEIVRCLR
jgi:anchored repeat ABC transporter substrate-binding protein